MKNNSANFHETALLLLEQRSARRKWSVGIKGMALFLLAAMPYLAWTHPVAQQSYNDTQDTEKKPDKPESKKAFTKLHIRVTGGDASSPVPAAKVDVTSEEEGVSYHKMARTDHDGNAELLDVPRGKVWVQVMAEHWDNGGNKYKLKEQEETVEIKLVRQKPG